MSEPVDQVLRAITEDDTFRVIVASTRATVRGAIQAQGASGSMARQFGELVTGVVLLRETMSPYNRVQGILTGTAGQGRLLADSNGEGATRGLVQVPNGSSALELGQGSVLQVMRTMASGSIYRGIVSAADARSVADTLMRYLQESEQVTSVVGIACAGSDDDIELAGGYVVQLLPHAAQSALRTMTERLAALQDTEDLLRRSAGSASQMLSELLAHTSYAQLEERPVEFRCWCTQQAVVAAIATLSRAEIVELLQDDEALELSCDYCRTPYRIARSQLQGLLDAS
jgi:molecular chaperone Hsp33